MKRVVPILICLAMIVFMCVPANAEDLPILKTPTLSTPTLTTPTLPNTILPPIVKDPTLQLQVFAAPSELKAPKVEYNLVSLQWKDNSTTETKFVIERKKLNGEYTQIAVPGQDVTAYDDASVESGTTYYYRVKAGKSSFNALTRTIQSTYSDYSNEITVNTPVSTSLPFGGLGLDKDIKLPGGLVLPPLRTTPGTTEETTPGTDANTTTTEEIKVPESLEGSAESENEIVLSWQDKSDNEEGFLLYRASTEEWEEPVALDDNINTYTDKNLQPNTTYYYVLFAYKGSSASAQSNIAEIKTPEVAAATTVSVAAPEALSAKVQNQTEVLLNWEDKSNNEEGFLIYRTVTGEWEEAAKLNANATTYTDKAVKANIKYYYILYAYSGNNASKESNMVEVTTPNQAVAPATVDFTGASSWAVEELAKTVEYGLYTDSIMRNYSQNITREEFCELVTKLYEKLKGTEINAVVPNPFSDTGNESILKAFGAGIVKGTGADTFSPHDPITRQDICVMLYRAITGAVSNVDAGITGVPAFADENLIGSWAIKEVKFAYKNNIMKGAGANKIMPKDNTNREQALILVKRVYEVFAAR